MHRVQLWDGMLWLLIVWLWLSHSRSHASHGTVELVARRIAAIRVVPSGWRGRGAAAAWRYAATFRGVGLCMTCVAA